MSNVNPYAAPGAVVADLMDPAAGQHQRVRMWSASGRIGRLRYLSNLMVSYLVYAVLAFPTAAIMGAAGGAEVAGIVVWVMAMPYIVFNAFKSIQRSHDMDWSGWWTLVALIPLVGLIWVFKRGTRGVNQYGAPPPPNSLTVKVCALILPVIAAIGIVAAIALPAYQDYVQRGRAVQGG